MKLGLRYRNEIPLCTTPFLEENFIQWMKMCFFLFNEIWNMMYAQKYLSSYILKSN